MQVDEPPSLLMVENRIEADKKSIAEAFIQSLRTENAELLTSISTHDVAWTLPGSCIVSGVAVGVAGTMKRVDSIHTSPTCRC